jgi:hypothetical protein
MLIDSYGDLWAESSTSLSSTSWVEEDSSENAVAMAAGNGGLQMIIDSADNVWARNTIGSSGWYEEDNAGSATAVSAESTS